jgi:hypothetical protein
MVAKAMQQSSCPSCGAELGLGEVEEAQLRIKDLEKQVELLTVKATTAGMRTRRLGGVGGGRLTQSSGQMRRLRRPIAQYEMAEWPSQDGYAGFTTAHTDLE